MPTLVKRVPADSGVVCLCALDTGRETELGEQTGIGLFDALLDKWQLGRGFSAAESLCKSLVATTSMGMLVKAMELERCEEDTPELFSGFGLGHAHGEDARRPALNAVLDRLSRLAIEDGLFFVSLSIPQLRQDWQGLSQIKRHHLRVRELGIAPYPVPRWTKFFNLSGLEYALTGSAALMNLIEDQPWERVPILYGDTWWLPSELEWSEWEAQMEQGNGRYLTELLSRPQSEAEQFENAFGASATDLSPVTSRESIPKHMRIEVWQRDRGRCVLCGSQNRLEFDHVIPHSRGGATTVRNLQLLCEPCNRKKAADI